MAVTAVPVERAIARFGSGLVALAVLPSTANAHGSLGDAGEGIAFGVVLALPVIAGLLGGLGAVASRGAVSERWLGRVIGILLVGLGIEFARTALAADVPLSIGGGGLGIVAALWIAHRVPAGAGHQHGRGDLALGGVLAHRLLEGAIVGALYGVGAAVGSLGAVAVAGHTALETAAMGGLYATDRRRAVFAIGLLQGGFLAGAGVGMAIGGTVPVALQIVALASVGGVLLIIGGDETRRATAPHPRNETGLA